MSVRVHFDRPRGLLVFNVSHQATGWIASRRRIDFASLRFLVDGVPARVDYFQRRDVAKRFRLQRTSGWAFLMGREFTLQSSRRVICIEVLLGDTLIARKRLLKSRHLLPPESASPLFFMHIPKTAGTALRHFVDHVFFELPALMVYKDSLGFDHREVSTARNGFAKTRDLFFGHFDYEFVQKLHRRNAKVITIFREPRQLIRSYLRFARHPVPEFLDNPMIRFVCGKVDNVPFGSIGEEDLERALNLVRQHFYIVQSDRLQEFADQVTTAFGRQPYRMAVVNRSRNEPTPQASRLPVDTQYDEVLYREFRKNKRSFIEFLND